MAMNSCMSLFVPHAQLEATARWQIVVRMQVEGAEIMLSLVFLAEPIIPLCSVNPSH